MLKDLKDTIREHPVVFAIYSVLRLIVIAALVLSVLRGDFEGAFVCVLVLILFLVPFFIEKHLKIELPTTLQIIILLFIFAAEILGELQSYFLQYPYWDTMLHTTTGFLCAAVGFSLVDILNKNEKIKIQLSPLFLAIVAFCFSMTIGVLWEFFEFGMDHVFKTDMQKDTVITEFYSTYLDEEKSNTPIPVENITETLVNGEPLAIEGYLDIGLYDTMEDLFVNFIGALCFSIIGFFDAKSGGKSFFARQFVPTRRKIPAPENAEDADENEIGKSDL